jgi:hypothetical protein
VIKKFKPFREIISLRDLCLIDKPVHNGNCIRIVKVPYYSEICLLVTVRCSDPDFFSDQGQTLVDATARKGYGWRLGLSSHGYLRFEDKNPAKNNRRCIDSHVPVHAVADTAKAFQVGLCMPGGAWLHGETSYVGETGSGRLRFFVISGPDRRFSDIGGEDNIDRRDMNPLPETMIIGIDSGGGHEFAGKIVRVAVYNTCRLELFDGLPRKPAGKFLPLVPGGSSFSPRWADKETIEVFTRPEFTATESYWVYLYLKKMPSTCRRLRAWTAWRATSMTPRFFFSTDGEGWKRIVPARVEMRAGDGRNFYVEFNVTGKLRKGGFLASSPPFTEKHREALLEWAAGQPGLAVRRIGKSVEGRPIHVIRAGRAKDGPGSKGVAVICGQHSPMEIMGGHVVRPVIEKLLVHPSLLDHCNFYFVPAVNVDCQHYGGNGLNANRRNTNRCWFTDIQPETRACIDYFNGLKAAGQRFDLAVDIHAGGTFRNHLLFSMGNGKKVKLSSRIIRRQEAWRDLLEKHAGLRRADGRMMKQQDLRATDYFHQTHGAVAFCLELSTCSYFDPVLKRSRPFGQEAFEILAAGMVKAWEEWVSDRQQQGTDAL